MPSEEARFAGSTDALYAPVPKTTTYVPAGRSTPLAVAEPKAVTGAVTMELAELGWISAVPNGADVPLVPKGVPVGRLLRFGTDRIAPKIVSPLVNTEAASPIASTCAGAVRTK